MEASYLERKNIINIRRSIRLNAIVRFVPSRTPFILLDRGGEGKQSGNCRRPNSESGRHLRVVTPSI